MSDYKIGDQVIVKRQYGSPKYGCGVVQRVTPLYVWATGVRSYRLEEAGRAFQSDVRPFNAAVLAELLASEKARDALAAQISELMRVEDALMRGETE